MQNFDRFSLGYVLKGLLMKKSLQIIGQFDSTVLLFAYLAVWFFLPEGNFKTVFCLLVFSIQILNFCALFFGIHEDNK